MTPTTYPLRSRAEVPTPPTGFHYLFRDEDNGALLTAKDSSGNFDIISVSYVYSEEAGSIVSMVNKIIDDAGCALGKGLITSDQYESIVDNINLCLNVNVDPVSGSRESCISNTPTLFVSLVLNHVTCNGESDGTVVPTITGGTAPYTTTYSGGADPTALAAGSYTVTVVDAMGKTISRGFIITEPDALAGTITATDTTSPGSATGTATVAVTGGTEPYSYLWTDGAAQTTATATALVAGSYSCTITDANGCTLTLGPVTVS